jgi:hypothetical protein
LNLHIIGAVTCHRRRNSWRHLYHIHLKLIGRTGVDCISILKIDAELLPTSQRTDWHLKGKRIRIGLVVLRLVRLHGGTRRSSGRRRIRAVLDDQIHILESLTDLYTIAKLPHPIAKHRSDRLRRNIAKKPIGLNQNAR